MPLPGAASRVLEANELPPIYLVRGLGEEVPVVLSEARARGYRVQPNHVFFAHGGFDPDNFEAGVGWARWSGTSFAAPVVAATSAQELAKNSTLTGRDATDTLLDPKVNTKVPCLGIAVIPDDPNGALAG